MFTLHFFLTLKHLPNSDKFYDKYTANERPTPMAKGDCANITIAAGTMLRI
jgi:hypothetical protein